MATSQGDFLKEYGRLFKNMEKLFVGQARVDDLDYCERQEAHIFSLQVTPNDGHYKNATCKFQVSVMSNYPQSAPEVRCLSKIFHPNIDLIDDSSGIGEVCVNLIDSDWQPGVGLDGCIMAILFLLKNPNLDDSLNPLMDMSTTEEEFAEKVELANRGEEVDGIYFDNLFGEEEDNVEVGSDGEETERNVQSMKGGHTNEPEYGVKGTVKNMIITNLIVLVPKLHDLARAALYPFPVHPGEGENKGHENEESDTLLSDDEDGLCENENRTIEYICGNEQ